jgi:hypothetical protein
MCYHVVIEKRINKMPTLGQQLRANIDRREVARIFREDHATLALSDAEIRHKQAIRDTLEDYKRQISDTITEGMVWTPQELPDSWGSGHHWSIGDARHPDNHLWHDFQDWADQQGLHVEGVYEGEPWQNDRYVLKVKPL